MRAPTIGSLVCKSLSRGSIKYLHYCSKRSTDTGNTVINLRYVQAKPPPRTHSLSTSVRADKKTRVPPPLPLSPPRSPSLSPRPDGKGCCMSKSIALVRARSSRVLGRGVESATGKSGSRPVAGIKTRHKNLHEEGHPYISPPHSLRPALHPPALKVVALTERPRVGPGRRMRAKCLW